MTDKLRKKTSKATPHGDKHVKVPDSEGRLEKYDRTKDKATSTYSNQSNKDR